MSRRENDNISEKQSSEGMMELFEIINARGDTGELKEIVNNYSSLPKDGTNQANASNSDQGFSEEGSAYQSPQPSQGPATEHNLVCNEELFYSDLRAIAEDASRED